MTDDERSKRVRKHYDRLIQQQQKDLPGWYQGYLDAARSQRSLEAIGASVLRDLPRQRDQ